MTFLTSADNRVSTLNSTATPLTASSEFLGTAEDVALYNTVVVHISSDVASIPLGVSLEFSQDNSNWDKVMKFDHNPSELSSETEIRQETKGQYFRIRYTNSTTGQSHFRLQTILSLINTSATTVQLNETHLDSFARLKISNPHTLLSLNHVFGKNSTSIYESITGSATSTFNSNTSSIELSTTGAGSVIRRSRRRSIYQPGKALLVMMTGCLNRSSNQSTVTTKIGHYDDESGHYFQYDGITLSIVERTSISGSLVEHVIPQSEWNVSNGSNIDITKSLAFWFELEGLGVGSVKCGVVIDKDFILLHKFRHSNLLIDAYMKTASLPPTVEIESSGGSGSMSQVCFTSVSEGGYTPIGKSFSANNGTTVKSIGNSPECVMALRIKSGLLSKAIVEYSHIRLISTTTANFLLEVYKFNDLADTAVLTDAIWNTVNTDSAIEYDTTSTAINLTNGVRLESYYVSANNDFNSREGSNHYLAMNNVGVSDLLCIVVTSIGFQPESYLCAVNWKEYI
jgi:hypothetical protein